MKNKNNDINKKNLRQSINWTCINRPNWKKLNALAGHCFDKRSRSKNKNIDKARSHLNVNKSFIDVNQSKAKIKGVKIKGGLQPHAATHTAFIVHAGNFQNALNREDATKYFFEVIQWLKKNLQGTLLHYSMHFDESTPHLHIMFENLKETPKGNYCSFRSLMNFQNQPKKDDREGLEFFVRALHSEVSKKFGFLKPRYNQETRTLDQYKEQQKETLKTTIKDLKRDKEEIEQELKNKAQEQEQQEAQLRTLRTQKNNLTIERTRIENIQKKTIEQVKNLQNLEQELKEIREQELKEIEQLRNKKNQSKELLKEQQEQQLKELKRQQEQQLNQLKRKQEQELKLRQEQQQQKEQELRQQEQQLKEQEQQLKMKKEETLRKWKKAKENHQQNFLRLKTHWQQEEQQLKMTAEKKMNAIIENLMENNSIDKMIEKEINLLNKITIKLEQATTKDEKIELIENIMKVKQQKIMRLKNSKNKNKTEIIEEIKKERQAMKKAKRELSR